MRAWIAGALGLCAGALIVLGYHAIDTRASRHSRPETAGAAHTSAPLSPFAPNVPHPAQSVGQVAEPTGPPAPARRSNPPAETAPPPADIEEGSPLPAYLQKRLEREPGPTIAQFRAEMAREARDPAWAPATEYQMQLALQEAAPELLGRIQLFQTTCASSMCEMVGAFNAADPEQTNTDMMEWQDLLHQAHVLNAWKATGLGRPFAIEIMTGPDGPPAFIVEFEKRTAAANKSLANRTRLTRASGS
jgi:hypothetical protein